MRRLLGAGRPARERCGRRSAGRFGRHPLDRVERLPGAGARARRPGGRHRRGPRQAGRPAPGAARDGRARRLPVRLLHAGLHLQHGRRVLPAGPSSARPVDQRPRRRPRARPQRFRPARTEREPVPLHRVPADPRRRVRTRRPSGRRQLRAPVRRRSTGGRAHARPLRRRRVRPPCRPRGGAGGAGRPARRHGDCRLHGLGRRGQPARHPRPVRGGRRPVARAAHVLRRGRRASRSVPRSPCPRPSGCSTAGCRCWTSCGRSSRPG